MHAATDRLEFAPPPTPGLLRALGLAVLAHAFLLAALTWGVHWKREAASVTVEAELWSALPQQAAPKLVEAPPPAAREPVAAPVPPPPQAQPKLPEVDIALAREKLRLKKKQELDRQKELEKQRLENLQQEKLLLEKKRLVDKRLQDKRELDTKKLEAQRQDNMKRMAGLAGATGAPDATGTALKSSGPSSGPSVGYAGRIRASIKPNIVFTDDITGNPTAELEVHAASDGTITSRKLTKSSGVKSWDDAVLRAIDKTEKLPRDVDGRVPQSLIISFRPKD